MDLRPRRAHLLIDNFDGEVAFWIGTMKDPQPDGWHHEHWPLSNARKTIDLGIQNPAGTEWWFARFGYTTRHRFPTTLSQSIDPRRVTAYRGFVVPLWFLTLVFAAIPVIATTRLIRSRRRQTVGLCAVCGYDLRASPERCPECGTPAR